MGFTGVDDVALLIENVLALLQSVEVFHRYTRQFSLIQGPLTGLFAKEEADRRNLVVHREAGNGEMVVIQNLFGPFVGEGVEDKFEIQ